jgi:exodeoxyribonuclease V alpha subunit
MSFILDESQKKAIKSCFENKITVITGAAGSGKSTICKCIFNIAQKMGLTVKMMSPTGKAAQVLSEKTGCAASTIHRALGMTPEDNEPKQKITSDILLIDEISMCGLDTMYALMAALENNIYGNIVFVGDKNQLPSVSPGNFLSDIIHSGCANVVTLDKIHRQSESSYISLLANEICKGKVADVPENATDIFWHELNVDRFYEDLNNFIDDYLSDGEKMDDLQVISPMKKGICGVYKINDVIQEKMANINGMKHTLLQKGFSKMYVGDRVIQLENNYDKMIFNGDMGKIVDLGEKILDPTVSDKRERYVVVDFYGEEKGYVGNEIDQLQLAWAITVHKFQGSQSKNIVFVMASEAQVMMSKELVYTAFTRASEQLDIFGHKNMLRIAPMKSIVKERYTNFQKLYNELNENKKVFKKLGE